MLYCRALGYDLAFAGTVLLGLADAAHGEVSISEQTRRLTLNALFVALGAADHLTIEEIAVVRSEMLRWHDSQRKLTVAQTI